MQEAKREMQKVKLIWRTLGHWPNFGNPTFCTLDSNFKQLRILCNLTNVETIASFLSILSVEREQIKNLPGKNKNSSSKNKERISARWDDVTVKILLDRALKQVKLGKITDNRVECKRVEEDYGKFQENHWVGF